MNFMDLYQLTAPTVALIISFYLFQVSNHTLRHNTEPELLAFLDKESTRLAGVINFHIHNVGKGIAYNIRIIEMNAVLDKDEPMKDDIFNIISGLGVYRFGIASMLPGSEFKTFLFSAISGKYKGIVDELKDISITIEYEYEPAMNVFGRKKERVTKKSVFKLSISHLINARNAHGQRESEMISQKLKEINQTLKKMNGENPPQLIFQNTFLHVFELSNEWLKAEIYESFVIINDNETGEFLYKISLDEAQLTTEQDLIDLINKNQEKAKD